MFSKALIFLFMLGCNLAIAGQVQTAIDQALSGLKVTASTVPYSPAIQRMYIGWNEQNQPTVGIAYREIEAVETITGVVIVHKTAQGFVLHQALIPDIQKINDNKLRRQLQDLLAPFQNISFDPHAEKSAVDGLTGATGHSSKISGYLNHMARRIALELENPSAWAKAAK